MQKAGGIFLSRQVGHFHSAVYMQRIVTQIDILQFQFHFFLSFNEQAAVCECGKNK